jgi:hypothetical protein
MVEKARIMESLFLFVGDLYENVFDAPVYVTHLALLMENGFFYLEMFLLVYLILIAVVDTVALNHLLKVSHKCLTLFDVFRAL